jgi:hypothetical protein
MTKENDFSWENEEITNIVREETKSYNVEFRERLVSFVVDRRLKSI